MKYIKTFESRKYIGKFWKVPIEQPYLSIALKKIGAPPERFDFFNDERFFKEHLSRNFTSDYIYIEQFYDQIWEWDMTKVVVSKNLEYLGEVEITKKDIEEYNMKKDAEKYNL